MSTVKMSLYEALSKKKILESRVEQLPSRITLVGAVKPDNSGINGIAADEMKSIFQSNYDKSFHLMSNYIELKAVINDTNASTQVEIGGKTYSIANAIARFRGIDNEIEMWSDIYQNIMKIKSEIEEHNNRFLSSDSISKYIDQTLASAKRTDELIESLTNTYKQDNTWVFFDPLGMEKQCEEKLEELKKFKEEYHYKLTEINCKTMVTVEYLD